MIWKRYDYVNIYTTGEQIDCEQKNVMEWEILWNSALLNHL
jgi:hypothetical protein